MNRSSACKWPTTLRAILGWVRTVAFDLGDRIQAPRTARVAPKHIGYEAEDRDGGGIKKDERSIERAAKHPCQLRDGRRHWSVLVLRFRPEGLIGSAVLHS
jgi:hypothetical protein